VTLRDLLIKKTLDPLLIYCKEPKTIDIKWDSEQKKTQNIANFLPSKDNMKLEKNDPIATQQSDISLTEWKKSQEIKEFQFVGDFKITATGDLNLKHDKVEYDGFRMLLTQSEPGNFNPKYDFIKLEYGIELVMDVPGIYTSKSSGDMMGGSISANLDKTVLRITGERKILYRDYDENKNFKAPVAYDSKLISRVYPSDSLLQRRNASSFFF